MGRRQKIRVDAERLRELFNEAGFLEPEEHGYTAIPAPGGPPGPDGPEDAVTSRNVIYFDRFGNPVAKAHEFLREDGSRTASGKPDPKRVLLEGKLYVLREPE